MRLLFFLSTFLVTSLFVHAQDTLILMTGDTLIAKVEFLNKDVVRFRKPGAGQPQQEADLSQVKAVKHADKIRNSDYEQGRFIPRQRLLRVDSLWYVQTEDGNKYIGTLEYDGPDKIILTTNLTGTITLPRRTIKKMTPLKGSINRRSSALWIDNPQAIRCFASPTAFGLRRGERYYRNINIFISQVDFGITDRFSVGVGTIPAFLFGVATPLWANLKYAVPVDHQVHLAGNLLIGMAVGEGGLFATAIGSATLGERDRNVTLGLGWGSFGDIDASAGSVSLSAMYRISEKGYLITDNWFIAGAGEFVPLLSVGGRTNWSTVALEYGIVVPPQPDSGLALIPWLGITVGIGK
jgi:hypothetical protein